MTKLELDSLKKGIIGTFREGTDERSGNVDWINEKERTKENENWESKKHFPFTPLTLQVW